MDPMMYVILVLSERCMQFELQNQHMAQRIAHLEAELTKLKGGPREGIEEADPVTSQS